MSRIEVFDPPMCCSTGACGPDPDPQLARFSSDLDWLRREGVEVVRYNLTQDPAAFAENADVKRVIEETDVDGLPVIVVDGKVISQGSYPTRDEFAAWTGVSENRSAMETPGDPENSLVTTAVAELIAIGAAIASNCEFCFEYHHAQARKLGVSDVDMIEAVSIAVRVKDTPAQGMVKLARRYLAPQPVSSGGCCGGDSCEGCG